MSSPVNIPQQTVPMFAPDGSLGDIPAQNLQPALRAGFKQGVTMKSSDGKLGIVPADRVPDAAKSGLQIVPLSDQDTQHPGFWHSLYSDLASMVPRGAGNSARGPDMSGRAGAATKLNDQQKAQQAADNAARKGAGYSAPYVAAAPVAEGLGVNVKGMEQSAAEGDQAGVAGHAVAGATPYIAGEALRVGAPPIADAVSKLTPQAMRDAAGVLFQDVKAKAGNFPVDVEKPGQAALNIRTQYQRGAGFTPPSVVTRFLNRITDPKGGPMTYEEARDFYSNASRLSADEALKMNPKTKMLLGQFVNQLGSSIQDAADSAGVGSQHAQAMQDYASAMRYADKIEKAQQLGTNLAIKGAATIGAGAAAGAGYKLYRDFTDQ